MYLRFEVGGQDDEVVVGGGLGSCYSTCFLFQKIGGEGLGVGVEEPEELEEGGMGNGHSGREMSAVVKWEVSGVAQGVEWGG